MIDTTKTPKPPAWFVAWNNQVFQPFVNSVNERLTNLETKVNEIDGRLTTLEIKVDNIGKRLTNLEVKVDTIIRLNNLRIE